MPKQINKILCILTILTACFITDQYTKKLAQKHIKPRGTIKLIDNYVIFKYAENKGAFLSIFSKLPKNVRIVILIALPSIAILAALLYIFTHLSLTYSLLAAFSFIIGGGLSNVFDRVVNNHSVIDFMNIGFGKIRTGVFNVADLYIMLGMFMLIYHVYIKKKETEKNEPVK